MMRIVPGLQPRPSAFGFCVSVSGTYFTASLPGATMREATEERHEEINRRRVHHWCSEGT